MIFKFLYGLKFFKDMICLLYLNFFWLLSKLFYWLNVKAFNPSSMSCFIKFCITKVALEAQPHEWTASQTNFSIMVCEPFADRIIFFLTISLMIDSSLVSLKAIHHFLSY